MEREGRRKGEKRRHEAAEHEDYHESARASRSEHHFQSNQDRTIPQLFSMRQNTDELRLNILNAVLRQEQDDNQQRKEVTINDTAMEHQTQKVTRTELENEKVAARPKSNSPSRESTHQDSETIAIIVKLRSENESLRTRLEASMEECHRIRQQMRIQTQEALDRNFALQQLIQQFIRQQNQEKQARLEQQQRALSSEYPSIMSSLANLSDDAILSLLSREPQNRHANESVAREPQRSQWQHQQQQHPNALLRQFSSSLYQSSRSASILASEDAGRNQAQQDQVQQRSSATTVPQGAIRSILSSEPRNNSRQERTAQNSGSDYHRALMDLTASSLLQSTSSTRSFAQGQSQTTVGRDEASYYAPTRSDGNNPTNLSSSGNTHEMHRAQLKLQHLTEELEMLKRKIARRDG